jgi:pyruvate kinase
MRAPPRRPELIATLGPVSTTLAAELARAGATAFRLNASHLEPEALGAALARVRAECPATPVVVDLQGAKMRVGAFPPRPVAQGARVRFALSPAQADDVPLPHPELFAAVQPGEVLSLDDDRLRCEVESAEGGVLVARWLADGTLSPRKGINRVSHPVEPAGIGARDLAHLAVARRFERVAFAWSFMGDGREAAWVRAEAPGCPVVGKVERAEAITALDRVLASVDEAWICRGDLGAQLGPRALAEFVARYRPPASGAPVLMAGQVLQHLARHPEPTRSEVCHLFELLARGYAGIVLSDETAVGDAPVATVATARTLLDTLGWS